MNRELLKRALDRLHLDNPNPPPYVADLCKKIETELAKPEPEPVAWMVENHPANKTFANFTPNFNSHFEKLGCKITPLYTTPPDQSARIAELLEALEDVIALSDRKHDAWDKAKAVIAKSKGEV